MARDIEDLPRAVIVISSHVVRGSVGNRAAVFALEQLGFPVWAVPTVLLPWHPGHGRGTRIVAPAAEFDALMHDLQTAPWLGEVGAVLSGYLGDAAQASAVAGLVEAVKRRNPNAIYMCDPVCGDVGGLYVPDATAKAVRDRLLPLADIATPNRFELQWLCGGKELPSNQALAEAALELGVEKTLVTSSHGLMAGSIGNLLVSHKEVLLAEHRAISDVPSGTGDLAAALFLGHTLEGLKAEKALQMTAASVFEMAARAVKRGADQLMLQTDAHALVHPMAMVQTRRLMTSGGGRRA